jgi:hypothetical protein
MCEYLNIHEKNNNSVTNISMRRSRGGLAPGGAASARPPVGAATAGMIEEHRRITSDGSGCRLVSFFKFRYAM